jgi:MFS family permease
MSGTSRFERMIRWYPPSWRARYGEEMVALLEDTHGTGAAPWRERLAIARAGSIERARSAGLLGDSASPNERVRAGSLLVLCAWAFFMLAGGIFAKFTEQWSAATPRTDRWLPSDGYGAVQWAGIVGVVVVLAAALIVLPAFLRLIRQEGWAAVRTPMIRALLAVAVTTGFTVGVVIWAHRLSPHDRNGGLVPYQLVVLLWVLGIAAALAFSTAAAVAVARHLDLAPRTIRVLGGLAIGLALIMAVVTAGTIVWWGGVAAYAPGFLGSGALSTSTVVPPPMIIAGVLMLTGLVLAGLGAVRVVGSLEPRVSK